MKRLTDEEVTLLNDGTEVLVSWSGGDGPYRYHLETGDWGIVGVRGPDDVWQPLDAVGVAPLTQVWLLDDSRGSR